MEAVLHKPGIVYRFRRPKDAAGRHPSSKMREALRYLAESDEMRMFVSRAHAVRRDVIPEVFHSREGHPLLIHIAATSQRQGSQD